MRMTATDIRQQQFAVRLFRGFDPQEVDAFLEEMADDFDELSRENALLKEQLLQLEEKSRGVEGREKTLQETLVTTQKIAEEFKENSRREAELVLREAHLRAEKFMLEAEIRLPLPPRVVMTGGEPLFQHDARAIGRAFGCPVVNQYAAWEVPHIAQT